MCDTAGARAAQGVASLPAALRDERLASARAPPARRGKEIRVSSPDDLAMVGALVAQVTAWLRVRRACPSLGTLHRVRVRVLTCIGGVPKRVSRPGWGRGR